MLWNLLVLALVGLIAGVIARGLVPGRQPIGILATITLGLVGSLVGGLIAWVFWPAVDGQFHLAGLFMSILGALVALWSYSVLGQRWRA